MAKEYNISKASGQCLTCARQIVPREEFVAVLCEAGEELRRDDYCTISETCIVCVSLPF